MLVLKFRCLDSEYRFGEFNDMIWYAMDSSDSTIPIVSSNDRPSFSLWLR